MPVLYVAPMVGLFFTSLFLVMSTGGQVLMLPPAGVQVLFYAVLIYVLAKCIARYLLTGKNKSIKWVLAALLLVNSLLAMFAPIYGLDYNTSIYQQYRDFFG